MTDIPDDLFQQVYNRAPTDSDRNRLLGVKATLGLSSRDELWPLIITLDHYSMVQQTARIKIQKQAETVLEAIKDVPKQAGPVAEIEAQRAVAKMIDSAADRIAKISSEQIAKISVEQAKMRADHMDKVELIKMTAMAGLTALLIAAVGAFVMNHHLHVRGVCAGAPWETEKGGPLACVVVPYR